MKHPVVGVFQFLAECDVVGQFHYLFRGSPAGHHEFHASRFGLYEIEQKLFVQILVAHRDQYFIQDKHVIVFGGQFLLNGLECFRHFFFNDLFINAFVQMRMSFGEIQHGRTEFLETFHFGIAVFFRAFVKRTVADLESASQGACGQSHGSRCLAFSITGIYMY